MKTDLLVAWPWLFVWACESVSKLSWLRLHPSALSFHSRVWCMYLYTYTLLTLMIFYCWFCLWYDRICAEKERWIPTNQPTVLVVLQEFYSFEQMSSCPSVDIIWDMTIVWRIRETTMRTVLCCIVYSSCTQWYTHTNIAQTHLGSCWF